MAKKRIKRNKRYFNTYDGGGLLGQFASWNEGATKNFMSSGVGGALGKLGVSSGGLGGLANGVASTVGGLINPSGNNAGVGNAIQAIGSATSNIPGIGGVIGAGVNLVGGLVNAAFGSNLNEEFIAEIEDKTRQQANYVSDANDNDSLMSDWRAYTDMAHVKKSDVGSDGWFSNKAKNKTKELNKAIDRANFRAWSSLANTASNIDTNNDMLAMSNFAAYGGPLFSTGAIGYELASRDLNNKQMKALGNMKLTSLPNSFNALPDVSTINTFAKGGGIHIKKKNRGKFTALKKRTGKSASWFKAHGTPAQKKMATFALNARKWKHGDGGPLFTHGGIWDNGMTYINEGGLHEENPFEGVQMGVDNQGIPNLVEEGEVVYNDYVFSNRMRVPKDVKKKLRVKGDTFAEAAKELSKESEERPNDPISKNGLDAFMSALSNSQEEMRMKNENRRNNRYAKGGKLGKRYEGDGPNSNFLQFYTPEEKFTRRLQKAGVLPTFELPSFEVPFTLMTPSQRSKILNRELTVPSLIDERSATQRWIDDNIKPMDFMSSITKDTATGEDAPAGSESNLSYLRYAPAITSGISAFSDIFSKPDYSASDRVASVDVQPALVGTSPIGQYLSYRPLDRMFYINQLNKNAAATRRAVNNNSGGNRAAALAGILAADANYGENLGKLARQAEEYNQALKERVAGFNRQTDMFNSQQSMQAQTANQASRNSATQMRLAQAERVAQLRQAARDAYNARRSNNLNSFITNLGNIGWEDYQREMINSNPALYYTLSDIEGVGYKGTKKNGGKLKKKRRTTYA